MCAHAGELAFGVRSVVMAGRLGQLRRRQQADSPTLTGETHEAVGRRGLTRLASVAVEVETRVDMSDALPIAERDGRDPDPRIVNEP